MPGLSLAELARDPTHVHEVGPEDAARLLSELASLTLALSARLAASPSRSESACKERWLTADQCAALAGVNRRQVYGWSRRTDWRPFARRLSRKALRIEESGFRRWMDRQAAR